MDATKKINWPLYNQELKNRGSITLWLAPGFEKLWINKTKTGNKGASHTYSDEAIRITYQIQSRFQLILRSTQGFIDSIFKFLKLKIQAPDYTTVSRRLTGQDKLDELTKSSDPIHVVLDSTGLKIYGKGEWKVRQHGHSKRRTWRKLHLAVNEANKEILAVLLTGNDVKDSQVIGELLENIKKIDQVTGDGAYDADNCYSEVENRGGIPVFPPKSNAVIHQHGNLNATPLIRDEHIRYRNEMGSTNWKIDLRYSRRSLAETAMYRFKTIFGGKLSSRLFKNQSAEAKIKCGILNKFKTPSVL